MSDTTTKERYPLILDVLYKYPITPKKKTAIMSYRTVCTPEENYVSDNTRQEGHQSVPFFTKLVMLVYGVTRAQVFTPWSTSCGGT